MGEDHIARAANDLPIPVYNPNEPPGDEAGLEKKRPPWREPTPNLEDVSLPDLQTLPPFDLRMLVNQRDGRRIIRFSNSVWNSGEGVLELRGTYDPQNKNIIVTQFLYGFDQDLVKRRVGEFVFHGEHDHWHWEGFSVYEIWTIEARGDLGEIVVTSGKVGYCMLDISRIGDEWIRINAITGLDIPDRRQYGQCHWRRQGISIGWVDTYDADTPGQVLDISALRDGLYALRSTVDPEGILYESDKENNSAVIYFYLYENQMDVIGENLPIPLPSALLK